MRGKALFPTINYKNMTVHVNFGPASWVDMPFKCRMLRDASVPDVEVTKATAPPSGKHEVLFPVGLPDEGTFEWLEDFKRENPQHTELSNRALAAWASKSGLYRQHNAWPSSNDTPAMDFGVRELDDYSMQTTIQSMAPKLDRDCIVMNVKNNLLADERQKVLANFKSEDFKKVALVIMGEPPAAYKEKAYKQALEDKRKKIGDEVRQKKLAEAKEKKQAAEEEKRKKRA